MKRTVFVAGLSALALTVGLAVMGCASAPKELPAESGFNPFALGSRLEESLRKHVGSQPQTWGDGDVDVYSLDPLRFEAFMAELDAGGEYSQIESLNRDNPDGAFAILVVFSGGDFELTFGKEDNSRLEYRYKKIF